MDLTLRGLDSADIPAWSRLLATIEEVDGLGEHLNEADLAEEMANPDLELGKDIVGAFVEDDLVGYFTVYPRPAIGEIQKIHLEGGVRPDHRGRGIGTALATAMRARALEAHRERHPAMPALLVLSGLAGDVEQEQLMGSVGLTPARWTFTMRAHLPRPVARAALPEGLVLQRFGDSLGDAMLAAHNAAFVDHPDFTPWSETMWKQWVVENRSFRPELSFVVLDPCRPGDVVAYLQTSEFEAHQAATGQRQAYVAKVGTRREYRGRGLASGLLARALGEYVDAGFDEAALDVDSENPTGALGIYERAGFEVTIRLTEYVARVPAEATPGA